MSSQPQVQQPNNNDDPLTFQSGNNLSISQRDPSMISQQAADSGEIKKSIKRIQITYGEKQSSLENLVDLSRKASRNITNYLSAIENETETFGKNMVKSSKNLVGSINWQSGKDFVKIVGSFGGSMHELGSKNLEIAQLNQQTISKGLGEFTDFVTNQKKIMQEKSSQTIKSLNSLNDKFAKQYTRYVKGCKEVEGSISEQKNSQEDIRLYYNVAYTTKQDLKIKDLAKEAEKEEFKMLQIIEEGNHQIEVMPGQIKETYVLVKDLFKQMLQRIIDSVIAIQNQQFNLLSSFNQYILDKKLTEEINSLDEDDQKVVQDRLFKKNPDVIPPGVNFIPIQSALSRKEDVSENSLRAYPEAAFQYLEIFEQILQERRDLMKAIKDFMGDMVDCYGNLYSAIESQSKEIKKALSGTKGDSIVDLIYAILKELIDQQQKQLESLKNVFNVSKAGLKMIQTCIADQQSQSNGFFNMTKKLFTDFNKAADKKKWVLETSSYLGISLDSFKQHEQKRLILIKDHLQKVVKDIALYLETNIKLSKEQQSELIQRREGLDEEIIQVFITYNKLYENLNLNPDGAVFEYQKQFSISSDLQKQLDEINKKQYISGQIDQITSLNDSQKNSKSRETSPSRSKQGSNDSQTSGNKEDNNNGSSKKEAKLSLLFGVAENDQPIDTFNCAFSHKILLQGKMYLFADRIGFHSYFNSQSFVGDTALSIPYIDVIRVDKRKNALIFDNSIAIITPRGELFFTSYVQRDNCHKLITYLMQTVRDGNRGSSIILPYPNKKNSDIVQSSGGELPEDRKMSDLSSSGGSQPNSLSGPSPFDIRKTQSEEGQELVFNSSNNTKERKEVELSNNLGGIDVSALIGTSQNTGDKGSSNASRGASIPGSPKNTSQKSQSPELEPIQAQSNSLSATASTSISTEAAAVPQVQQVQQPAQPVVSAPQQKVEDLSWIDDRRKKFKAESMFEKVEKVSEFELLFQNVTPREIFNILFGLNPYKPQPEGSAQFPNFRYYIFQEFQKDTDIKFENFSPAPPEWYTNLDNTDSSSFKSSEESSVLEYKVVHPVREKIPFGPKVSHCANKEKYYWISPEEFIIEREISLSKIPYSDYFAIRFQYNVSQVQGQTKMTIKLYVFFMKSTTFKGRIENGSLSENTEVINLVFKPQAEIAIQNYLKFEKPQREERLKQQQQQKQKQAQAASQQMLQNPLAESQILQPNLNAQNSEQQQLDLEQTSQQLEKKNQVWIEERRKRFKTQSLFTNVDKTSEFELLVPDVHPREVFNIIFLDNPYKPLNSDKTFPHFMHYFMEEFQKDVDMQFGKFSPPPPEWYTNLDCVDSSMIQNFEDYSLHEYKYVHPVREKIPFGPKVSQCENKEKYFWISADEFIMEKEVFLSKIPYCDYFTIRFQYQFMKNDSNGTKIICKLYVNFMKSTTFKGRIESGSLSENTDVWKNAFSPQILSVMQNYVKNSSDKRNARAELLRQSLQSIRLSNMSSASSAVVERTASQNSNSNMMNNNPSQPPKKSKREIIMEQQNQIGQLYKLNEERFKQFNKRLVDMQGIIDHQNNQFKNILYVIIVILLINLIHLFK